MHRATILASLFLVPTVVNPAHAGRSRFGWLFDTETIPQRGVEVETWYLEEDGKGDPDVDESKVLWQPVIGVTDRLELAFPLELAFERETNAADTALERFGAELRWRLTDPDPVERGPFAPLLRLGAKRLIGERDLLRLEANVVLSLDAGPVHLAMDLGAVGEVDPIEGTALYEARPGAGASVRVIGELRLGAEFYGEIGLGDHPGVDWYSLGPNVAWTHGRFWLSGSFPIGLKNIDAAPRVNLAIAF